jgi:hypothetical protein
LVGRRNELIEFFDEAIGVWYVCDFQQLSELAGVNTIAVYGRKPVLNTEAYDAGHFADFFYWGFSGNHLDPSWLNPNSRTGYRPVPCR